MVTVQIKAQPPKRIRADATQIGKLYRAFNSGGECAGIAIATDVGVVLLQAVEAHGGTAYLPVTNPAYSFELANDVIVTLENTDV